MGTGGAGSAHTCGGQGGRALLLLPALLLIPAQPLLRACSLRLAISCLVVLVVAALKPNCQCQNCRLAQDEAVKMVSTKYMGRYSGQALQNLGPLGWASECQASAWCVLAAAQPLAARARPAVGPYLRFLYARLAHHHHGGREHCYQHTH